MQAVSQTPPRPPQAALRDVGPSTELVDCPGGPLLVRGPATVVDADGREVPRRRGTVALCRCAATSVPPWCDGSHKLRARGR